MAQAQKVTDEKIIEAYQCTGNVWIAGKIVGICGQSVHERLVKLGIKRNNPNISRHEKDKIVECYRGGIVRGDGKLKTLALELNRSKTTICQVAKKLGLTDRSRTLSQELVSDIKTRAVARIKKNGHPRGALGLKHSEEVKKNQSKTAQKWWSTVTPEQSRDRVIRSQKTKVSRYGTIAPNVVHGSWKAGWRDIGGKRIYARSRWEANYARYLQFLKEHSEIKEWEHEPETFWFEGIKRGCCSYLPDFKITNNNETVEYHEVKGWMDDRSKTKIKRMAKYYPHIKLIVIDATWFKQNTNILSGLIKDWEMGR